MTLHPIEHIDWNTGPIEQIDSFGTQGQLNILLGTHQAQLNMFGWGAGPIEHIDRNTGPFELIDWNTGPIEYVGWGPWPIEMLIGAKGLLDTSIEI